MLDFHLVRQPIFTREGGLVGYEVRFRDNEDGRHAFAQSFLSGTFDLVRDGKPAFVTCTRGQLLDQVMQVADPRTTVPLIPPHIGPDPEILEMIDRYRAAGGKLALDSLTETPSPSEALLPLVDFVRVDVRCEDAVELGRIADRVAGKDIKLIADHVYDDGQYNMAVQLGFDAFEGSYLSRPEPLAASDVPASTMSALRLLGQARDPNTSDVQLEASIAADPVLTFQLLRIVNSASVGARGVTSIGHAIRLLGRAPLLRWLALAIAASRRAVSDLDQFMVLQAVERARLCEQLAGPGRDSGTLFLVGLFSLIEGVFRVPLDELLERVPLAEEARDALLHRTGPYAPALDFADAWELGLFDAADGIAQELGIDPATLAEKYTGAVSWTREMMATAGAEGARQVA